jgi:hypothetical protein
MQRMTSHKKTLSYALPQIMGAFIREYLSVALLMFFHQRVKAYDLFNGGFVLFLILIVFRVPYINSYTFFFEFKAANDWNVLHRIGGHTDPTQLFIYFIAVLGAHVAGAISAAAATVYCNVMFGVESMTTNTTNYLTIDIDGLRKIDDVWGADKRIDRLVHDYMTNGTRTEVVPLRDHAYLGIDSSALYVWYFLEDFGYVLGLCVCFLHVMLAVGIGEDTGKISKSPFRREYWMQLFPMSILLSLVYIALDRTFPTAHGSLHVTTFKYYYQQWNPSVYVIDNENNEGWLRIFGSIIGLVVAYVYNSVIIATSKPEGDDYYYRLVWGFERPKTAAAPRMDDDDAPAPPPSYNVCVSQCNVHADKTQCTAACVRGIPVFRRQQLSIPQNFFPSSQVKA